VRRIRYRVAASLDGYIADTSGGADWITHDPDVDFAALFAQFDTFLIGRRTFEEMARAGRERIPGAKMIVFSRTLRQEDWPGVTVVADGVEETLASLRAEEGKDIWLFGGGVLFRNLLDAGLVDSVEVAIIPVLLGGGIQLLPPPARQTKLVQTGHRIYKKSGIVLLEYSVRRDDA
jgi:dihydrofolate reductase